MRLVLICCFAIYCSAQLCSLRVDFVEWKNATCSDNQNTGAQVFTHASFISRESSIGQRPLINYYLIKEGTRYSRPNQSGRWSDVETGLYSVIAIVKELESLNYDNFKLTSDQPSNDDLSPTILYDSITHTLVDESTLDSEMNHKRSSSGIACQMTSQSFLVSAPNVLRVSLGKVKPTKDCCGQNGQISLDVHGGVQPIFYSILNTDFYSYSPSFSAVPSGDHIVVVRDSGGCTLKLSAKVEVSEQCANPMFNFWSRGGESGMVVLLVSLFLVFLIFQYLYVFIVKKDREIDSFIFDAQQTRKRLIESRMTRKKNAEMEAKLIEKLLRKEEKRKKRKKKRKQKKQKKPIHEIEFSEEDCASIAEEAIILPQMSESEGSFQDAYSSMYSLNSMNLSNVPSFFFSMLGINYFPNLTMDSLLPFPGFSIPIQRSLIERNNFLLSSTPNPCAGFENKCYSSELPCDLSAIETRLLQQLQPQIQFFKQQELNDTQMFDVINTLINSQYNLDITNLESAEQISDRLCDYYANVSETATVVETQTLNNLEEQSLDVNDIEKYIEIEENSVEEENKVFEKKKEEEKRNESVEDDYTEIVGKVGEESSGDKEKSDEDKSIEGSEKENRIEGQVNEKRPLLRVSPENQT